MTEHRTTLAFLDIETTGLSLANHEVWEVALQLHHDGGMATFVWQLPVDLARADPMALNIGRFHERRLPPDKLAPLAVFAQEFMDITWGAHLVGMNPAFDAARLEKLLLANRACPGWNYHLVDVEALIAGHMGIAPPWRSTELSLKAGVDPADFDRHTAIGDVEWTVALYAKVMGEAHSP